MMLCIPDTISTHTGLLIGYTCCYIMYTCELGISANLYNLYELSTTVVLYNL